MSPHHHHPQKSSWIRFCLGTPRVSLVQPHQFQASLVSPSLCWPLTPCRVFSTSGRPEALHLVNREIRLNALDLGDQITIYLDEFSQAVVFSYPGELPSLLISRHDGRRLCLSNFQLLLQILLPVKLHILFLGQCHRSLFNTAGILE